MSLIKNYEFIRDWVNHRLATDLQNYYTSSQVDTAIGNVSSSLSNYDTSTQVDTKIANAIAGVTQFDYEIVQALPASGVKGKFYLLPNNQSGQNVYDEYLYIGGNWEKLGPQIDLSDLPSDIFLQISQYPWDSANDSDFYLPTGTYSKIMESVTTGSYVPRIIWRYDGNGNTYEILIFQPVCKIDDPNAMLYCCHYGNNIDYYIQYTSDTTIESRYKVDNSPISVISSSSTNTQSPSALAVYNYVEDRLGDIEAVLDEIITPTPILQASAESLTFECVAGSTQALTFTVGGNYLRGNINIAETDTSNVFTLNPTAGNNKITKANGEANTTVVTVTFAPSTAGQYTGSMTFSSTGAEPLTITFSATATAAE